MDLITTAAQKNYTPPGTSIVHNITASLVAGERPGVVHIMQYDQTLPIIAVRLMGNNALYAVPSGAAVNFRARKPDGKYIYNPALGVSADGSTAYIAVTPQTAAAAGKMRAVIEIVLNGTIAATASFCVDIAANPVPQDAIESSDEYKTAYDLLQETQAAADAAKASKTAAAESATAAAGSATAAQGSAAAAASSANTAGTHANAAQNSAQAAASSKTAAASSATAASGSADAAANSASNAAASEEAAQKAAEGVGLLADGTAPRAIKLATARTINNVPFDGTQNITVEDATKLPLTGGTVTGQLVLSKNTDVEANSSSECGLVIGNKAGAHLAADPNEIMAKSDETTPTTLYINNNGGLVRAGDGGLSVGGGLAVRSGGANVVGGLKVDGTVILDEISKIKKWESSVIYTNSEHTTFIYATWNKALKILNLYGSVSISTTVTGTKLFTLPSGVRPGSQRSVSSGFFSYNTTDKIAHIAAVTIDTNGDVKLLANIPSNDNSIRTQIVFICNSWGGDWAS